MIIVLKTGDFVSEHKCMMTSMPKMKQSLMLNFTVLTTQYTIWTESAKSKSVGRWAFKMGTVR